MKWRNRKKINSNETVEFQKVEFNQTLMQQIYNLVIACEKLVSTYELPSNYRDKGFSLEFVRDIDGDEKELTTESCFSLEYRSSIRLMKCEEEMELVTNFENMVCVFGFGSSGSIN